jgi:hypothetical protein
VALNPAFYRDLNIRLVKDQNGNTALLLSYWDQQQGIVTFYDIEPIAWCFSFDEADEDAFLAMDAETFHTAIDLGFDFSNACHTWIERGPCARAVLMDYLAQFDESPDVSESTEDMIAFVRKMKQENPRAFEFLGRGATDLLSKIEEDEEKGVEE